MRDPSMEALFNTRFQRKSNPANQIQYLSSLDLLPRKTRIKKRKKPTQELEKRQLNFSIFIILTSFFGCPLLSTTLPPSLGNCKRNPHCKLWFKTRFQSKSNCGSSVWIGLQLEIRGIKILIGTVWRWRLGIVLLLCSNIPSFVIHIMSIWFK